MSRPIAKGCAERWKHLNARLGRIEAVLAVIMLLLLIGEGSVIDVLKRLLGGCCDSA